MTKLSSILKKFYPEAQLLSYQPLGNGHINQTLLIQFQNHHQTERIVLQQINTHVFKKPEAIMSNIALVSKHLQSTNYPYQILMPLLTTQKEFGFWHDGGYWRAYPYLSNAIEIEKAQTEKQAYDIAKCYGHFTRYLENIDLQPIQTTILDFHNGIVRWQQFEEALKNDQASRKARQKHLIENVLALQNIIEEANEVIQTLPIRLIHYDTKINNVLVNEKTMQPMAVVDLDTLMKGCILSDFGDMVRTFTNSTDEDCNQAEKITMRMPIFQALTKGFLEGCGTMLTPSEKKYLVLGSLNLVFMQVIRFLTDYLNGDVYYNTQYAEHNLDRTLNQWTLLQSMLQQQKTMEDAIKQASFYDLK